MIGRDFVHNLPIPETFKKAFFDAQKSAELRDAIRHNDSATVMKYVRRHKNPVVPDIADVQPWMYYDKLTAAAGASPGNLLFFTTPLSSTKSKLSTNLKQAGRLPDPKHFLVMSLRFVFDTNMLLADIQSMVSSYYVEFEIGDKIYAEGHFDLFPGGAGIAGVTAYGVSTTASTTTVQLGAFAFNNGVADPNAVNMWGKEHGIHILQGQTFQVRATAPTAITLAAAATTANEVQGIGCTAVTAGATGAAGTYSFGGTGMGIRAVLDGILYREVQ